MSDAILILNAGSSSIKVALFALGDGARLATGEIQRIGARPQLRVSPGATEAVPDAVGRTQKICASRGWVRRNAVSKHANWGMSGSIAASASVLHLLRDRDMTVAEVEDLLSRKSGLLGVSGQSDDMRDLLPSDAPRAREAVDLFAYRAVRQIGSLAAALSGLDALVFTGGIGEHSAEIRRRIVALCAWLGLRLDADRNAQGGPLLSSDDSAAAALAIPTDEEGVIARQIAGLLDAIVPT